MRTLEVFFMPGLKDPEHIIGSLPERPRPLHLIGENLSIAWRVILLVSLVLISVVAEFFFIQYYVRTGTLWSLCVIVALFPFPVCFIPWWVISSYKNKMNSFQHCENIYKYGIATVGTVNTLTCITGEDCHHIEHDNRTRHTKTRVDYTFMANDELRTGTIILKSSNATNLFVNDEICVIYMEENPSDNIIFPIPGDEFFNIVRD